MSKNKTVNEFEQIHGQSKIKQLNHDLQVEREKVAQIADKHDTVSLIRTGEKNTIKFAVFGDTQIGSLYSCPENCEAFLSRAADEGCRLALHTGDVLDGWKVYRGQEFELADIGMEKQLDRLAKLKTPEGLSVKFITGNHDLSFKSLAGAEMGKLIEERTGWKHIGDESAIARLQTAEGAKYDVGLYHLGGGTAYAVSYKIQKHIESLEGGRKPQMALYGHFHKADWLPAYRNVSAMQTGAFQWQTPFMQRMASASHVGGWIISVTPGTTYNIVKAEFTAFYRER